MNYKLATTILLLIIISLSLILIIQKSATYQFGDFEIPIEDFNALTEAADSKAMKIYDMDNDRYVNILTE